MELKLKHLYLLATATALRLKLHVSTVAILVAKLLSNRCALVGIVTY